MTLEFTAKFDHAELDRRTLKVLTTEDGRYRAEFIPSDLGNNLFLFFYAAEGFDGVRFQRPDGIDITKRLQESKEGKVLRQHEMQT